MMEGTITVTLEESDVEPPVRTCWGVKRPVLVQRRVQLKRPPIHLYNCLGGRQHVLNQNQSFNIGEFVMRYNEEHLLMVDLMPNIYRGIFDENGLLKIDAEQPPVQICFRVRLMLPRTVIKVGPQTPLSLLLDLGCLEVKQVALGGPEFLELLNPEY
jgi:hypothetical protein